VPISIRNPKAEALAREVAARAGETMTQAISRALEERLARLRTPRERAATSRSLLAIARRINRRQTRDRRSAEKILGYDRHGLPR
jgi:antitoxin VapB